MGKDSKGAYNDSGQYVKTSRDGEYFNIYSKDPSSSNHERVVIKTTADGKFTYTYHNGDKSVKDSGTGHCYLTTACMQHYQTLFDDNCFELTVLRWFRDNFVSKEDIDHYYQVAPIIVDAIDASDNCDLIYDYIYDNIIDACVSAIKNGDYKFAYERYKSSILSLEENFARRALENRLIKVLTPLK